MDGILDVIKKRNIAIAVLVGDEVRLRSRVMDMLRACSDDSCMRLLDDLDWDSIFVDGRCTVRYRNGEYDQYGFASRDQISRTIEVAREAWKSQITIEVDRPQHGEMRVHYIAK